MTLYNMTCTSHRRHKIVRLFKVFISEQCIAYKYLQYFETDVT